jgi:hypothetical protein
MASGWRRIGHDLRNRRHIDAYSVALASFVLSVLSLVTDIVPDDVRWAALLAGVGILVVRATIPNAPESTADDLLSDRRAFEAKPISDRVKDAREICIFAPTGINFLSASSDFLRTGVLNKPDGKLRVVVLNPSNDTAIQLAARQLDDSVDYRFQDVGATLQTTIGLLSHMSSWRVHGSFEYRFLDYNPGFSLVITDPASPQGKVVIEFHGFHNPSTASRMHIELQRGQSDHWYTYWVEQFNQIWETAVAPPGLLGTAAGNETGRED